MYEMKLNRKWHWWEWTVSDGSGKVAMFGREISRRAARSKPSALYSTVADDEQAFWSGRTGT
jgi:hypothetical protein